MGVFLQERWCKAWWLKMTNPKKSPKMEPCALNFFCYLATVSPQAAELLGADLGWAPSKRWMQILNARERVACVCECQPSDMLKHILNAVNKRLPTGINGIVSFSIATDATTKVPQLLEISTAFKAIMGGAHPHHLISTIDLDSTTRGQSCIYGLSEDPTRCISHCHYFCMATIEQWMFHLYCRHHECCWFGDQAG